MSEAIADPPPLDLREQIVRIDRAIAETQKFQAEANKLTAEERKLLRDASAVRWQITVAAIGGVAGLIAAIVTAAKVLGVH